MSVCARACVRTCGGEHVCLGVAVEVWQGVLEPRGVNVGDDDIHVEIEKLLDQRNLDPVTRGWQGKGRGA